MKSYHVNYRLLLILLALTGSQSQRGPWRLPWYQEEEITKTISSWEVESGTSRHWRDGESPLTFSAKDRGGFEGSGTETVGVQEVENEVSFDWRDDGSLLTQTGMMVDLKGLSHTSYHTVHVGTSACS